MIKLKVINFNSFYLEAEFDNIQINFAHVHFLEKWVNINLLSFFQVCFYILLLCALYSNLRKLHGHVIISYGCYIDSTLTAAVSKLERKRNSLLTIFEFYLCRADQIVRMNERDGRVVGDTAHNNSSSFPDTSIEIENLDFWVGLLSC